MMNLPVFGPDQTFMCLTENVTIEAQSVVKTGKSLSLDSERNVVGSVKGFRDEPSLVASVVSGTFCPHSLERIESAKPFPGRTENHFRSSQAFQWRLVT